jgi:3-phosphoshikimate 1-carboxyvinyltransferase
VSDALFEQRWRAEPVRRAGGIVTVPGDKSISHRALMLGGIAEGPTDITGFLASEDCLATLGALRALGVRIERPDSTRVVVHGTGLRGLHTPMKPLNMGNAGTAMRLFMGLLAPQPFDSVLYGDHSLMRRPMERVAMPLRRMGAYIRTRDGAPPVEVMGRPLHGIDYQLPVASAQVKSALLLAGLHATGRTRITEPVPTRDHTERMFAAFGVALERDGLTVEIEGGQKPRGAPIAVPADFSSAAFFIVAGCIAETGVVTLRSVGVNPTRTGLLELLRRMGADIRLRPRPDAGGEPVADIDIRPAKLKGIEVPESLVPLSIDELPVFFIAAAAAEGETVVRGAQELRVKESDRLAAMAEGLTKLGVENQLLPDGLRIKGGRIRGGAVDSHGDHRVAMAFAVASMRAEEAVEISDVANVATSFPGFVDMAREVGLVITQKPVTQ